jgi:hypothetical protein
MRVRQTVGAVVTSLGIVAGMAGMAGATSGVIGTTGPFSNNQFTSNSLNTALLTNNNTLPITTTNAQSAFTGSANVAFNTQGGSALTGAAQNQNSTNVNAWVNNGSSAALLGGWFNSGLGDSAVINTTGPSSNNQVFLNRTNALTLTNNNVVPVTTTNTQTAISGSANVSGNTFGGSAITGNASNSNNTSVSVNVAN